MTTKKAGGFGARQLSVFTGCLLCYELGEEIRKLYSIVCLCGVCYDVAEVVVSAVVFAERSDVLDESAVVVSEIIAASIAELFAVFVRAGDGEFCLVVPAAAEIRFPGFVLLFVELTEDVFRCLN